jgi:general secretion pathway protein B
MSFILDALRKSEHARERRTLPGLADVAVARVERSKVPRFLIVLGALLAVNLVVLLVVLLRPARDVAPAAAPSTTATPATAGLAQGATVRPVAPALPADAPVRVARDVRSLQDEASESPDETAPPYVEPPPVRRDPTLDPGARVQRATGAPPVVPDGVQSGSVPNEFMRDGQVTSSYGESPGPAARSPAPMGASSRAATVGGAGGRTATVAPAGVGTVPSTQAYGVPSINDLSPQATAGLPTLGVSLHVYASQPAERFVVLNGRRYQEGAQIAEGPTLERITPDGVILNHRGLRFLLPRQ